VAFRKLKWRIEHDKNNYMSQTFGCWLFQISSVILILYSRRDSADSVVFGDISLNDNISISFSRFLAIMIMHVYVLDEIKNGMQIMKYAMNHWWKFKYPGYAFLAGLL